MNKLDGLFPQHDFSGEPVFGRRAGEVFIFGAGHLAQLRLGVMTDLPHYIEYLTRTRKGYFDEIAGRTEDGHTLERVLVRMHGTRLETNVYKAIYVRNRNPNEAYVEHSLTTFLLRQALVAEFLPAVIKEDEEYGVLLLLKHTLHTLVGLYGERPVLLVNKISSDREMMAFVDQGIVQPGIELLNTCSVSHPTVLARAVEDYGYYQETHQTNMLAMVQGYDWGRSEAQSVDGADLQEQRYFDRLKLLRKGGDFYQYCFSE